MLTPTGVYKTDFPRTMSGKSTLLSWLHYLIIGELTWKRLARSIVLIPLVSVVGLLLYGYMFTDRIIFQPPRPGYTDSDRIIKLTTEDGAHVSAMYLRNENASYTILYSHGNAEDLSTVRHKLSEFHSMGFSAFGYDYRGYGTSEGHPSETAVYRDIDGAYDYLRNEQKTPPDRIILYGFSLGGAVAADLASRRPVAGLILESTFVSAFRVITRVPMPYDQFNTLGKLGRISCPVLVMHGRADSVIGFWHGEKLFENANEPKQFLWIDSADHGDISIVATGRYENAIKSFVSETQSSDKIR